jgi:hypothetical protein
MGPQNPRPKGPERRRKGKPLALKEPKQRHKKDGNRERPRAGMDKKKQKTQKSARIHKEKPDGFLRIAPVNLHSTSPLSVI